MARIVILLVVLQIVSGRDSTKRDTLNEQYQIGAKFVKDFLGTENVALKVADFVVRAFQTKSNPWTNTEQSSHNINPPKDSPLSSENLFSHEKTQNYNIKETPTLSLWRQVIKIFGLQTNQISAVAVNALIFIAQMITTFLSGPKRQHKPYRYDDLQTWILNKNSRKLQDIIATAKNESLPDLMEQIIDNNEDTTCIRLLICKVTPFVSKMQRTIFNLDENEQSEETMGAGASVLYRHLPTKEELSRKSDACEQRHRECNLLE